MKKILISSFIMAMAINIIAQPTIVSTQPTNKKVVIEEFTGANCPACPNGHKVCSGIANKNSGKVFVINVHYGSYAPTSPAEIDYTTTVGNGIGSQAVPGFFPSASVNRHLFTGSTFAMDISKVETNVNQELAKPSPVNLAIDINYDYDTRELTILTEVYYTDTAFSSRKLNIALLQDWVKGPQSGMSSNPNYVTEDGMYMHMHMLRELITGQWGIDLPADTAGAFWDSTFKYTIPEKFKSIPAIPYNISVLAFIAENKKEIITADQKNIPLAPLDISLKKYQGTPASLCQNNFTPKLTIYNNGLDTIKKFDISYKIGNGAEQIQNWTGSLVSKAEITVSLPEQTLSENGKHTITVKLVNPNDKTDYDAYNDEVSNDIYYFADNLSTPVLQNFSSTTFPPAEFAIVDATPDGKCWARANTGHDAAGSAFINWYGILAGKIDDLVMQPIDLTGVEDACLSFYVAYRQYTNQTDKLQVDVSTNCGTSWVTKFSKSGSTLKTGAPMTSAFLNPTASEWRLERIDLSDFDNKKDVMIRFRATSNYGNNLFIDDINVYSATGIKENNSASLLIYPNPTRDLATIEIDAKNASMAQIQIFNTLGEVVYNSSSWINTGKNTLDINTSAFSNGIYFVNIKMQDGVINQSLIISE